MLSVTFYQTAVGLNHFVNAPLGHTNAKFQSVTGNVDTNVDTKPKIQEQRLSTFHIPAMWV